MKTEKIISWVLLVVMIIGALLFGAYRGWTGEYADVTKAAASLREAYTARMETAYNVLTVAKRHLPAGSERIAAVSGDHAAFSGRQASLADLHRASEKLTADAAEVSTELRGQESLQADERDSMYASQLLPQMLDSTENLVRAEEKVYSEMTGDYNARFDKYRISSFLAGLFGVSRAETLD